EALLRAACELDPTLQSAAANLAELERRRKRKLRVDVPSAVAARIGDVERRATDLARRAKPAAAPESVALCMIVKDEERVLERCLASVAGVVDELVVVDTGSTDRTVEIARAHGATVLTYAWNDDFAAARNVGLEAATSDWILFLDADEELGPKDGARLRELTRRTWREGYTVEIHNKVGTPGDTRIVVNEALRLFRNRPSHRFDGRVHENVGRRMPADAPERLEASHLRIDHDGYLQQTRDEKDKTRRNLELLERQLAEEPPTAFLLYNLGSEYAVAGRFSTAIEHFARGWDLLLGDPLSQQQPFGPSLAVRYADTLRHAERFADAALIADQGLKLFPAFTDLVRQQALVARGDGRLADAAALLGRCLKLGDAPSQYLRVVGAGSFIAATELGEVLVALGDAAAAATLLQDTLADHPFHLEAVAPLAAALLAGGGTPDDVVAAVAERVGELSSDVRFALAAAFQERGAAEAAEAQLRVLLDDPGAAPAPVQLSLAEALLAQARFADADEAAAAVPDTDLLAPLAATTQAFAAIVSGDEARIAAALARLDVAGVHAAERDLLVAWAGAGHPSLTGASLTTLLTYLEALLRVEQFDAFGALLPLAGTLVGIDVRDLREQLAQMYLRRGFLDSAADEWAAVCQESGPDARALTGLARVAAAHGNADDARDFAEAATELDPSDPAPHRILAALS
ncbi:MAG TPA: glycosyltransferase, partial [Solirubrobacteraceae bacterium]|nr:glycosyltransferase [Solirubrobacteraceae bacterium]